MLLICIFKEINIRTIYKFIKLLKFRLKTEHKWNHKKPINTQSRAMKSYLLCLHIHAHIEQELVNILAMMQFQICVLVYINEIDNSNSKF